MLALAFTFSGSALAGPPANARTALPRDHSEPAFTQAQALGVLAKARRQLRRDTARVRARQPVGTGPTTEITMTLRDLFRARPALRGDDRRAADDLLARPTDGPGDNLGGAAPVSFAGHTQEQWCPEGGVACIHWVTTGPERISATDSNRDGLPDYVTTVYDTIAHVWGHEVGKLGYRAPLPDQGSTEIAGNPDEALDIYLADLGTRGLYGYCAPEGSADSHQLPGYCVLDNDYATAEYGAAPLNSLRVTAAHELFHVVQFAYDVDEDSWMMEGTATWIEDEVYDSINDNVQFLVSSPLRYPRTPLDYSADGHRYGSFLFFKYAAERFRDPGVVRQFWEQADAPRGRYSLQAIRAVVAARKTSWPAFFALFGSWNTLPAGSYSERSVYPSPALGMSRTLSRRSRSTGWHRVNLPHLASSAVRVTPHARLGVRSRLKVELNLPDTARGATALLQRRYRNGTVTHSLIPLDRTGGGRLLTGFDRRRIATMLVVVSNTSTTMRDCENVRDPYGGPVFSCFGRGSYDAGQTYSVRVTLR